MTKALAKEIIVPQGATAWELPRPVTGQLVCFVVNINGGEASLIMTKANADELGLLE